MTLFFVRKRFGNYFGRASSIPVTILLIVFLVYFLKWIEFDFIDNLGLSLMNIYILLMFILFILGGVILITGYEGVVVDIKSREIEYFKQVLGFNIGKNKFNIELSEESYILIFNTKYTDFDTPLNTSDSFYEVSIVDANCEKLQILETTSYKEARESAYKLSKFLEIELKDRIKGE